MPVRAAATASSAEASQGESGVTHRAAIARKYGAPAPLTAQLIEKLSIRYLSQNGNGYVTNLKRGCGDIYELIRIN